MQASWSQRLRLLFYLFFLGFVRSAVLLYCYADKYSAPPFLCVAVQLYFVGLGRLKEWWKVVDAKQPRWGAYPCYFSTVTVLRLFSSAPALFIPFRLACFISTQAGENLHLTLTALRYAAEGVDRTGAQKEKAGAVRRGGKKECGIIPALRPFLCGRSSALAQFSLRMFALQRYVVKDTCKRPLPIYV